MQNDISYFYNLIRQKESEIFSLKLEIKLLKSKIKELEVMLNDERKRNNIN